MVICECGHDEALHYQLAGGGHACGFCDCRELCLVEGVDVDADELVEAHERAARLLQIDDAEIALRFDPDAGSFQAVLRRAQNGAVAVATGATILAALQTLAQQLG